jgi:DeoR family fructose operon transcriptional repressor
MTATRPSSDDGAADSANIAETGEGRLTSIRPERSRRNSHIGPADRRSVPRRADGGVTPRIGPRSERSADPRTEFAREKVRIAKAALEHVPQRGTVVIDAGSTTAQLVEMFPTDREMTVYTNTLTTALILSAYPLLTVFSLGGRVRSTTCAAADDWAVRALAEINVDVAFLGANGISVDRGLTTPHPSEAAVKRHMLAAARQRIILADHSKIGLVRRVKFGALTDVDLLITDTSLEAAKLYELRSAGMTVEQA